MGSFVLVMSIRLGMDRTFNFALAMTVMIIAQSPNVLHSLVVRHPLKNPDSSFASVSLRIRATSVILLAI
jgi:hypothetical protein